MTCIPTAPTIAPRSISDGIAAAASAWYDDPERPRLPDVMLARWSALLEEWCSADDIPLLIRKARDNRGHALRHSSGRILVPADNSPAHWSITLAYSDTCPSLDEVRAMLSSDKIPVAMAIKAAEKSQAKYKCTRQAVRGPNALGWKVAHIDDVGLGYSDSLESIPPDVLCAHFKRFLSPANMFLVPKAYAGVAETPEFIEVFRSRAQPA
jgi:hypothetical protein